VAALASWLDARAHGGRWLVRMEDVDTPRCVPGADQTILTQLAACGLQPDEAPLYQTARSALYAAALQQLIAQGRAYPCGCTRQDIALALAGAGQPRERHGELVYPGTCRHGLQGKTARAWRFATQAGSLVWNDRHSGPQSQDVSTQVGDFVLHRTDGLWAYQLAVVVDDAAQGVSHVVRGQDLADNSARQIQLQRALGLATPQYLHTPLVLGANGEKLSKQNGAQSLDLSQPLAALNAAAYVLGLPVQAGAVPQALAQWTLNWATHYGH
jgi:glutamyl-Q tRNA(Asp) synthetase